MTDLHLDTLLDRVPPNNLEAEQSALGSMMIDRPALDKGVEILKPSDFYREAHKTIFDALIALADRNEPVDIVTVQEELRSHNRLEDVGGTEYLMALIDSVPSAANVEYYSHIVEEKAILRRIIDQCVRTMAACHGSEVDIASLVEMSQRAMRETTSRLTRGEWTPYVDMVVDTYGVIEEAYRSEGDTLGVPSGLPSLDSLTCGWQEGDLIFLAARPRIGKTALVQQIAEHAARNGYPTAFFSLEMTKRQLGYRALQRYSGISSKALRSPRFSPDAWATLGDALGDLDIPLFVNDMGGQRYQDVMSMSRKVVAERGVKLIILDFLGLTRGPQGENRNRELGLIAEAFKTLAKDLSVPFICLSQLSRKCEQEKREPQLSDLRDSGDIEAAADVVIFLHREPALIAEDKTAIPIDLIVAKNRQFSEGVAHMIFKPREMRFVPKSDRDDSEVPPPYWAE